MKLPKLLLLLLLAGFAAAGYEAPDDCELDNGDGNDQDGFSLTCHLSAINSDTERTNFSVIPSSGTAALTVVCSDAADASALEPAAFADLRDLRELSLVGCRLGRIPSGAFLGLEKLEKLTVRTSRIAGDDNNGLLHQDLLLSAAPPLALVVEEGAFSGLPSLKVLDLSGNGLRSLPPTELCSLPELRILRLSGNEFGSLRDVVVEESGDDDGNCLSKLSNMDLSDNQISSLEGGDLPISATRNLEELSLASNFLGLLSSLPPSPSLRVLDLGDNMIASLPSSFASPALTDLSLANNSLSELTPEAFRGLASLQRLDLSSNSLTSAALRDETLSDLESLLSLDLSGNEIDRLAENLFASTSNLEELLLDGNRLESLPGGVLFPLRRLRKLELSSNKISTVEAPLSLPSLTHLHLAGNRLSDVGDAGALSNCTSVLVLDLSRNRLAQVPASLASLEVLQTLDLSHNEITSLSGSPILRAENLWRLQLSGNRLSEVGTGLLGGLRALQVLDLSSNLISVVEMGAFDSNEQLSALRLDGNRLTDISGLFRSLPGLNWLNVSDNAVVNFDYAMLPRDLHWLDVSHNRIGELGNRRDAANSIRLRVLNASFNRLRQLGPGSVPDSVETLLVNDNAISQVVPYTFFKKTQLRRVDLTVNELRAIDRNALRLSSEIARLPDFYLGGNPIECDCEMAWFKSVNTANSLQNHPIVQDIESIYCRLVYTREVSFVPLVEARNEQFLCPYETHCFALCKCCDFDACDCEMSCPDNCTCYHDNSWSKNIAVCSGQGFSDLPEQLPMDATEIFLDGNVLTELDSHTFIGRKNLHVLHLNNSQIGSIQNKTFNGLKSLSVLHLEDNNIASLGGHEFESLSGLRELYLQNNAISSVASHTFKFLRSLEVLHLHGNRIIDFPVWQLAFNPFLVSVRLAENLWSCDCEYMERFRSWMSVSSSKIFDAESVTCVSNEASTDSDSSSTAVAAAATVGDNVRMSDFDVSTCTSMQSVKATTRVQELVDEDYLPLLAATLASFALVLLILLAAFLYRHTLRVYIHSKYGVRVFDSSFSDNDNVDSATLESGSNSSGSSGQQQQRLFDVFISYSPKDDHFVREVLARELEVGQNQQYHLCLHHRDIAGATTTAGSSAVAAAHAADTVVRAAAASRRTVVVLSENFLRSEWSRYEYKSALHQALRSGLRRRLLVVTLGDVNSRDLDPDLRLYLKTSIVLPWGDRLFWEKLRYALPDVPIRKMKNSPPANMLTSNLILQQQQQSEVMMNLMSNNNLKPAAGGLSTLDAASIEGHYYQQPRYATYLPPPPPSSVATPVPSISGIIPAASGNDISQRMLPSPPPPPPPPPMLVQQPQLYSPGAFLQQQQQQHQFVMPNLPGPQQPQLGSSANSNNNRSVVMHI